MSLLSLLFLVLVLLVIGPNKSATTVTATQQWKSKQQQLPTLADALAKAAGVYENSDNINFNNYGNKLEKTVVLTACNYAYINHLHNLRCFLRRLHLKLLVVALDMKTYRYLIQHMPDVIPYHYRGNTEVDASRVVQEGNADFRTPQFHIISGRKKEVVLQALLLGYDVLFVDPDVVVLQDPWTYLLWNHVDYVHSVNQVCPNSLKWDFYKTEEEGNTGFYFIRSNNKTIELMKECIRLLPQHPNLDDQTIFWTMLRSRAKHTVTPLPKCIHRDKSDNTLTTCHLDGCLFSAGNLRGNAFNWLREHNQNHHQQAVTVHANFLKGNEVKMKMLRDHQLWIAEMKVMDVGGDSDSDKDSGATDYVYSLQCSNFTSQF